MIRSIRIRGFKRFVDSQFDFKRLTVLAGLNGTGKTSLIHALLLAREALGGGTAVRLNGPFGLELGTAQDVRNWETDGDLSLTMVSDESPPAEWRFGVVSDEALFLKRVATPDEPPIAFSPLPRSFTYLCAERLGPRNVLGAAALPTDSLGVGVRGDFCAQVLTAMGDRPLMDDARLHPDTGPNDALLVKYQVERWLSEIVRPVELDAEHYPGTSTTALRFRAPGGDWVRAPNMGFGVSYALPVVLGGLVAACGGLLLVENPEAHLHPAGQSRMGGFLAWLSACGVQVVLETHSDHVLNGIRRAIGEHHHLRASDAVVHSFEAEDSLRVSTLRFTETGGLSDWPSGFFDQYQIDVAALGRVRRRR